MVGQFLGLQRAPNNFGVVTSDFFTSSGRFVNFDEYSAGGQFLLQGRAPAFFCLNPPVDGESAPPLQKKRTFRLQKSYGAPKEINDDAQSV